MQLLDRKIWYETNPADRWASDCPFCKSEQEGNNEYVIWRWKHWFIAHNKYPILWLSNQFLAIPYRHVLLSKDLNDEEYLEFREVEKCMSSKYESWSDYFMFIREWLPHRSLEHIHYHFVPGRIPYEDIKIMLQKQGF
jgi:diadenosine tetraphosphate (Ap4A) HIT family hydrolase